MFALLKQARTGFFITMIGLMLTSIISPVMALAATDLVPGDDAVVLQDTRLYSETSRDSNVTAEVAKDTPVTIVEGPVTADDSTQWYWVRVYEQTGYMQAVDLEGLAPAPTEETPAETENATDAPATRPWQEPVDYGVAIDTVVCRIATSTGAQELTQVSAGQTIEITGFDEVWAEGIAWLPVNCGGEGGFIAADYISLDPATEVATEVPTEVATEVPTEVITEVPVETEVATEVATEVQTETEVATEVATEVPTEPEGETETEAASTESSESVTAGAAGAPIGTATATDDVVCRVDASVDSSQITIFVAGQTIEITGVPVDGVNFSWTPVNCSGVGGFVASEYIDAVAADVPEEEATDEATEEATDEATDEGAEDAADEATEDATDAATEDATDEATEDAADEGTEDATDEGTEDATDEATEDATDEGAEDATDEEATEDATDEATEDATDEATEDAADEATEDATDEGAEDAADEATEDATDEGTEDATDEEATDEEMLESGQAVPETESNMVVEDSAIIGTAIVKDTNGAGVACRTAPDNSAPIIRVLPEDMSVHVLSEPDDNGWMSIVCNNEVGYAPSAHLWQGGAASDFSADSASYANVNATGGAGLNCRSGPGTNHSVIGYFPAGSGINVRGAAQGDWVPVVCGGQNGWVHGDYVIPASSPNPDNGNGNGNDSGGDSSNGGSNGTMVVSNTGGDNLYCRATPGGSAITLMAPGTEVSVRGATENGWVPIVCAGQNGYASAQYLSPAGGGSDNGSGNNGGGSDNGSGNDGGTDASTGTATVVNTDGQSLRCRTSPGGSIITNLSAGQTVQLRAETSGAWQGVICAGQNGFAHSDYLSTGGNSNTPAPDPDPAPSPSGLGNGDHARTTDRLNLRYGPSTSDGVATVAPAGTVVLITGGVAANNYYPVNWDGLSGYMSGDYLVKTDEALSKRGGSGNPNPGDGGGGGGGSATGNAIVDYAMGYLGYPYVWATHGPYSFDCSGFTYWVVLNVTGQNIGTGTWTQANSGTPVSRNALQPGDLVFFQNTYTSGLSHVGIYIGGDQFIHAQNEETGVVISDLNSNYYGSRWYGARRIV